MTDVHERLKEARIAAGFATVQEACEAFGFKYPTYAGHENGQRGMKADAMARYARAYNISVEWLLTGKKSALSPSSDDPFLTVPIYDIRASAGAGALVEDGTPTGFQPYREQEISRLTRASTTDLTVIQVAGDSMWETLHDGDKVLVDRTVTRIVRDGIYILSFEGELLVKRCQRDLENGHVIVKSDNPAYDSFRITDGDRLDVIGRVIWIGRALG
ncbi:MAG: helix-turn-helix transcriptional regulator [Pseudomonadota bacterium]